MGYTDEREREISVGITRSYSSSRNARRVCALAPRRVAPRVRCSAHSLTPARPPLLHTPVLQRVAQACACACACRGVVCVARGARAAPQRPWASSVLPRASSSSTSILHLRPPHLTHCSLPPLCSRCRNCSLSFSLRFSPFLSLSFTRRAPRSQRWARDTFGIDWSRVFWVTARRILRQTCVESWRVERIVEI